MCALETMKRNKTKFNHYLINTSSFEQCAMKNYNDITINQGQKRTL